MSLSFRHLLADLTKHRLAKASYHAVFAMAVGLIVLDILLRLVMIEKKTASEWLEREPDHETEGLLSSQAGDSVSHCDAADPRPTPVEDDTAQEPDHPGEHTSGGRAGLPGLVRIMFSGSMLVVLLASLVNAMVGSSFDAVGLKTRTSGAR